VVGGVQLKGKADGAVNEKSVITKGAHRFCAYRLIFPLPFFLAFSPKKHV
jgi:hypothetical protein